MFQIITNNEKTFMMIKPDGVQRNLIGQVISRIQNLNLKLIRLQFKKVQVEKIKIHYSHHSLAEYFQSLIQYMISGPVVIMAWQGPNAIKSVRRKVADSDRNCSCGTIRGDFSVMTGHFTEEKGVKKCIKNICHASDSKEQAQRQLKNWFPELFQKQNISKQLKYI